MAPPKAEGSRIPRSASRDNLLVPGFFRPNRIVSCGSLERGAAPKMCNLPWRGTVFGASRLWYTKFAAPSLKSKTRQRHTTPNAAPLRFG
jgi:hypothetical protein